MSSTLDDLCDLLDDEEDENIYDQNLNNNDAHNVSKFETNNVCEMKAELQKMREKMAAMEAKLKERQITDVDLFTAVPSDPSLVSPVKLNLFVTENDAKHRKQTKLYTPKSNYGPALPTVVNKPIIPKEESKKANDGVKRLLGFNEVTKATLNLSNGSANKVIPKNFWLERNSQLRITNSLMDQTAMEMNLLNRKFLRLFRLKDAVQRGETEGDWATIGVLYYKTSQKSKNGNSYTIWYLSDLTGSDPNGTTVAVFLFGKANTSHWKMSLNKVVGLLNAKILPDRFNGNKRSSHQVTLSIDHPDKILELGDSLDAGKCQAMRVDGIGCTNLVNLGQCEYCIYHVKKAYKTISSRRSAVQSSYSGFGDCPQTRILAKILPKKQTFITNGQEFSRTVRGSLGSRHIERDRIILDNLGGGKSQIEKQPPLSDKINKIASAHQQISASTHLNEQQKQAVLRTVNDTSQELGLALLDPSSVGSRCLLRHLTNKDRQVGDGVDSKENTKKSPSQLLMEHRRKKAQERAQIRVHAQASSAATPELGRDFRQSSGFIDLGAASSSNNVERAIKILGGQKIKKNVHNAKEKQKINKQDAQIRKRRVLESLDRSIDQELQIGKKKRHDQEELLPLKSLLTGQSMDSEAIESLKKAKSKNMDLVQQHETEQQNCYFDVLEKKELMEQKMLDTKEMDVKVVICKICDYSSTSQSDLCRGKGHRVKFIWGKKRFFECKICKSRIHVIRDKIPSNNCLKCGESNWIRVGMIRERKGPRLDSEKLLIRGTELKFINGTTRSDEMSLDLD